MPAGLSSRLQRLEHDPPTMANTAQIVVEALTRNVKEDHVREIFGKYGIIKDLKMPMNPTCALMMQSAQLQKCTMHNLMVQEFKSPLYSLPAAFRDHHRQRAEVHRHARGSMMITMVMEADVAGVVAQGDHPVHTDRLPWMLPDGTAPHREDGRPSVEGGTGDEAGVDKAAVEVDLYDHGRILDHEVGLRVGVDLVHPSVDQCREHRRDVMGVAEGGGEATGDGIRHLPGVGGAVVVVVEEEGEEALATVPMAVPVLATVVGAEIGDDRLVYNVMEDFIQWQ
ncbi:hypothetical protein IAQ61_003007 [Plenodomus lingam]|uniref:uncharacterized protein n=1 Tax=Leptosphaeria maculans TaxID=5022 RepID=UPI00331A7AA0|nr:hypothetical protein IAQ61_003007 [Plenodomus lingam]